jgi:phosphate transport system permease protein
MMGVVVLSILLGAVIATAQGHKPDRPWYALWTNARDLGRLMVSLFRLGPSLDLDPATTGFRVGVISSLWLLGLVVLVAIPIGVGTAVFLEEFAPPGRIKRLVQTNIANLAGVPSIVYGILGLTLFVRAFGYKRLALGYSLWAGGLTLSVLVLPVLIIAAQEALRAVPSSLRQAAMALGATRWQAVRDHVLPAALPGIFTGVILALSRAIGETAPVLMVSRADSVLDPPTGPESDFVALPQEIYTYAKEADPAYQTLVAGGILLLLLLLLSMNAVAIVLRQWTSRRARF